MHTDLHTPCAPLESFAGGRDVELYPVALPCPGPVPVPVVVNRIIEYTRVWRCATSSLTKEAAEWR